MTEYLDQIKAETFWVAPEYEIFSLPVVAIALLVGRNKMKLIPVQRIMVEKRICYRKSDILNWLEIEQKKGTDSLWLKLKAENSSTKRSVNNRSKFYDHYYSKSDNSHYKPSKAKGETKWDKYKRLKKEWRDIWNELTSYEENQKLEELISIAWSLREQFVALRLGLPRGIELGAWWFEKDINKLKKARLEAQRESLISHLEIQQDWLDSKEYINLEWLQNDPMGIKEYENKMKTQIDQIKSKLKELG